MKDFAITDFAAIIGIDWADRKHDVCELTVGSNDYQLSVIKHKPQALQDWALSLHSRTAIGTPCWQLTPSREDCTTLPHFASAPYRVT